jgi:hypothetical protein
VLLELLAVTCLLLALVWHWARESTPIPVAHNTMEFRVPADTDNRICVLLPGNIIPDSCTRK